MVTRNGAGVEITKEFKLLEHEGTSSLVSIREKVLFLVATMGIDLIFLFFMTGLLVTAVVALGGHIRILQASVGLPLGIMAGLIIIKYIQSPLGAHRSVPLILRDWVPFLFIAFIYENLHDVAGYVMRYDVASYMYHWDKMIFGTQPTIWMQNIFSPLLTDIMSVSYALYFAFPLVIMFFLSLAGRRRAFRRMVMCLTFVFIIGFLCYVFFPCSPPRYFMPDAYTNPHYLTGFFLYNRLQGMWDGFSVISGGAFPSLHVGLSTVALIYAYKFRHFSKVYYWIWILYIPLVTNLWISTVYLRHHWFIDILAGWVVAFAGYFLASYVIKFWERLRHKYALPH